MDFDLARLEDVISPYVMVVRSSDVHYVSSPLADMVGLDREGMQALLPELGDTENGGEETLCLPGGESAPLKLPYTRTTINGMSMFAFFPKGPSGGQIVIEDDAEVFMSVLSQVDRHTINGFVLVEKGHIVYTNDRFLEFVGYTRQELLGTQFLRVVSRERREPFVNACVTPVDEVPVTEVMLTSSAKRRMHVTMNAGWVECSGRSLLWMVFMDITEKKALQRRLGEEHLRLQEFFERAPTGILLISPRGKILESNAFVSRIMGYSTEEIRNSPFTRFVSPHEVEPLEQDFRRLYHEGDDIRRECVLRTKEGQDITIEYSAQLIMRKHHKTGALMLFSDITEKKALEEELLRKNAENERGLWEMAEVKDALEARAGELNRATEELKLLNEKLNLLSITDGLTEVFNHRFFQERLNEEIERLNRVRDAAGSIALLMLDIDDFKRFNDTFGHQCGDMILKQLACRLRGAVRSIDIVARYGGEEFAVILPQTHLADAHQVALRICEAIGGTAFIIEEAPDPVTVTVSIGVARLASRAGGKADLIRMADNALYQAKHNGKNRVEVWQTD